MTSVALPAHAASLLQRLQADALCFWRSAMDGVAHPVHCLPAAWIDQSFLLPQGADGVELYLDPREVVAQLPFQLRARLRKTPPAALAVARLRLGAQQSVGVHVAWSDAARVPAGFGADAQAQRLLLQPFLRNPTIDVELALSMRVRDIADSLPHGAVLVSANAHAAFVNPIAAALLRIAPGLASADSLAVALQHLVGRASNGEHIRAHAQLVLEGAARTTASTTIWRFDSVPRALRVTFSPLRAAPHPGWIWLFEDVSAEVALHDRVAREERKFHALYDRLSDAIVRYGLDGEVQEVGAGYIALFGEPRPARALSRWTGAGEHAPLDWSAVLAGCLTRHSFGPFESECVLDDGRRLHLESSAIAHREADGAVSGIWEVHHDVTRSKLAEAELVLAAEAFGRHSDGVLLTDPNYVILTANDAVSRISGYERAQLQGAPLARLRSGRHPVEFYVEIDRQLRREGWWQGGVWSRRRDGEPFFKWVTINAVRDDSGRLTHYVLMLRDIEAVREAQSRIEYLSTHDPLTRLPNRLWFEDRLDSTIRVAAGSGAMLGIVLVELKDFTQLSTAWGRASGERLLASAAERLRAMVPAGHLLAHLEGERFAVMAAVAAPDELGVYCANLLRRLAVPHDIDGAELFAPASIGVCVYPEDGASADELLVHAEAALQRAALSSEPRAQFFTEDIVGQMRERFLLENGLRKALERDEFNLVFQPQIVAADGRVHGCEALLRWAPAGAPCSPGVFIPVAERAGLIVPITQWVLRRACREIVESESLGLSMGVVGINLSATHFQQPDMAPELLRILRDEGVDPRRICLEITEGALLDPQASERSIAQLQQAGCSVSIDDFGTGFSSLAYLRRLRVDELKIDRSFVEAIERGEGDRAIVASIISMGHALGMRVVAEGIETAVQREFLEARGCDLLQGYALSRPLPAPALREFLHCRQDPSSGH